jgi:Uncharacterized conserved protein
MVKDYSIVEYPFDRQLYLKLIEKERDYLNWPIVYLLSNLSRKEAYVGETTDMLARMKAHRKISQKSIHQKVSLIRSSLFNKSATLDIEANLIKYLSADGELKLQNGNLGISNHLFYQKNEIYWRIFKDLWNDLKAIGIARHSLEYIDNSDLFKYSPYKSLSREQTNGLKMILECLLDDRTNVSLIHGGAGTGKSILAIFLFKLLKTDLHDFNRSEFEDKDDQLFDLVAKVRDKYGDLEMGLVIPMQSFRKTISGVFKHIKGLSSKMVIGPSEVANKKYDLLIVDEAHRLRQWRNLAAYFGTFKKTSRKLGFDELKCTELDWILKQSQQTVLFYDEFQSIKPSDVNRQVFIDLQSKQTTRIERLHNQFRVKGGEYYIEFIHKIFSDGCDIEQQPYLSTVYDFRIFSDLKQMVDLIKKKDSEEGLCRMVAGFAWEWVSKNDRTRKDIVIDSVALQWNSSDVDWVNSHNAINEVGCIHTIQGYDLNYTGVIVGPELDYDFTTNSFVVDKDQYKDRNGKNTITDAAILKEYVLNIYRTMLFRGIKGTFVYACNPNVDKYLRRYISSAIPENKKKDIRVYNQDGPGRISLYDLKVAAGNFSAVQQAGNIGYIEVEPAFAKSGNYFACKVIGESMNKVIPDGSICLFEKYEGGSRNGLICLVELQDFIDQEFGANYTIKEYSSKKLISEDGWVHQEISLIPRSFDSTFKPVHLREEETVNLKVIGIFVKVLDGNI